MVKYKVTIVHTQIGVSFTVVIIDIIKASTTINMHPE